MIIMENDGFKRINYENRVNLDLTSSFDDDELGTFPYGYCKSDRTLQGHIIDFMPE